MIPCKLLLGWPPVKQRALNKSSVSASYTIIFTICDIYIYIYIIHIYIIHINILVIYLYKRGWI